MQRVSYKNKEIRMSKEEFFARVDNARAQAARGEGRLFTNQAEMNAWLNSL